LTKVCLLLLLSVALASQHIGLYDLLLDPGRISSWRSKWLSSKLELSKTNQGAANVAASFFISPSNSITAGVFEVTFPAGFDVRGVVGGTVVGQTVQVPATFSAGQDSLIVIQGFSNPVVAGPYGPFALRTRMSATGQLVDVNLNFGNCYISTAESPLTVSPVTYLPGSSNVINKANNGLSFKFVINKSLWTHDLFRITVPTQFSLSSPVCLAADISGRVNNFNGTDPASPHSLNCVASAKGSTQQVLWVYGLATDIDTVLSQDNRYVELRVTGFTNPDRDYPDSAYVWKVETIRFNTKNVLEAGIANGPNTAPDTFTTYSWTPTWGRPVSSILAGQTMFMDFSFTLVNPIPSGSYATVVTNVGSASWGASNSCYVVSYLATDITCKQTAGGTVISGLGQQPAGTKVVVRTLTVFTSKSNVAQIVALFTRSAETWAIDTASNIGTITFPSRNAANAFTLNVLLQEKTQVSARKAGGTGADTQYIKFQLAGIGSLVRAGNTAITISCPIFNAADDLQFGIPMTSDKLQIQYNAVVPTPDFTVGTKDFLKVANKDNTADGSVPVLTAGSVKVSSSTLTYTAGTLAFTAGTNHVVSDFTVGISVSSLTGLKQVVNSGAIILPRVATNPSTVYECSATLIDSSIKDTIAPAYAVGQFIIDMQDFDSASNGFTYFCARGTLGGAPVKVTFLPSVVDIYPTTSTQSYYVEIELPTDTYMTYVPGTTTFHLSGLVEGEAYPMDSNLSTSPTMTVTTVDGNNSFFHRVTGLGNVSPASSPVEIYFPVGIARSTQPTLNIRSYYQRIADPRFKHYTHRTTISGAYTIKTGDNGDGVAYDFASISEGNNQVDGNTMGTTRLSFTMRLGQEITGDAYFYVVFPRGYSFSSLRNVLSSVPSASTSFSVVKYFSATNLRFAFPGVLVKATTKGARISSTQTTSISFVGVNVPLGVQTSDIFFVHGNTANAPHLSCAYSYTGTLVSVPGAITSLSVSPNIIPGRGPNGVDITHTIIFTLPHGIDKGGSIVILLNSAWSSTAASECSVKGVNDASVTSPVVCTFTGNVFVISNFADFSTGTQTTVTATLQHLLPPVQNTMENSPFQLLASLTSYVSASLGGTAIDDYTPGFASIVTVNPSLLPGLPGYNLISVQPPNAGTIDNDLYLELSFPYDLPAWTTLSVSVPYPALNPAADIKDRCYLAPLKYRTCGLVSGAFVVVLQDRYTARTTLELFIDHAVNVPAEVRPPVAGMHYVFRTLVTWFGASIIDDGIGSFRASQELIPAKKMTTSLTTGLTPLTFFPRTALETATYSLSFQNSVPIATDDELHVIWPDEFDPYLGNAERSYKSESGAYYLPCFSPEMGTIYCRVDHWIMVIKGTSVVPQSTAVTIQISGVVNPGPTPSGNFKLLHVDKSGGLLEYSGAFGSVTPSAFAKSLEVRSITVSDRGLGETADYEFQFYTEDIVTRATQLWVTFPSEYSLALVDQKPGYSCSTFKVDESVGSARTAETWNPSIACFASDNTVYMPAPSSQTVFTTTDAVTVQLQGVKNPQWAQARQPNQAEWDYDDYDRSIWTVWSWWTNQFKVALYQSSSAAQTFSSKTYGMLNAAYLGFLQAKRTISVNGYNPQNKSNRITVYPGTQSADISISTANSTVPVESRYLVFTPNTNTHTPDRGLLAYSSYRDNWVLLQDETSINFRVAADKAIPQGIYYISWGVEEGVQTKTQGKQYSLPAITLVEVPAKVKGRYTFQIADIPPIAIGASSIPIRVSISNPPHTAVSVNIRLQNAPATLSVSPAILTFKPDINSLYFYIHVNKDHDELRDPAAQVLFSLSGVNAEVYAIQSSLTVAIERRYVEIPGSIARLEVIDVTRTSFAMRIATDQLGVLYYQVAPKGTPIPTFEEIKANLPTFVYTSADHASNLTSNAEKRQAAMAELTPPEGFSWSQYQHYQYHVHMLDFSQVGAIAMFETDVVEPIRIAGLWAQSVYQLVAYLDTLNPTLSESEAIVEYVTTADIANIQPVSITLNGLVNASLADSIGPVLAKYVGVNPGRVPFTSYSLQNITEINSTQVDATVFEFTVLPSRSANLPVPSTLAALSPTLSNDFTTELKTSYSITVRSIVLEDVPDRVEPTWIAPPSLLSSNSQGTPEAVIQFQSTNGNSACCIALEATDQTLQSEQVWEGYSSTWMSTISGCSEPAIGLNTVTVPYLSYDTTYYIHCVAGDQYLLWPTLMTYSETVPVPFVTVHTGNSTVVVEDLTGAEGLKFAAVLSLFLV